MPDPKGMQLIYHSNLVAIYQKEKGSRCMARLPNSSQSFSSHITYTNDMTYDLQSMTSSQYVIMARIRVCSQIGGPMHFHA
jgi:hypothetical protein